LRISSQISLSLKKRAAQIRVLLMDVDGTMTDGGVTLLSQTEDVALEIKTFDAHDGQDGSEDFVGVDAHVGGDVVEQGGAQPEAVCAAVGVDVAAVDDDFGAVGFAGVDVGGDFVPMCLRHGENKIGI